MKKLIQKVVLPLIFSALLATPIEAAEEASIVSSLLETLPSWFSLTLAGQEIWQWLAFFFGFLILLIIKKVFTWTLKRFISVLSRSSLLEWNKKILELVHFEVAAILSWLVVYLYLSSVGYTEGAMDHFALGIKIMAAIHIFRALYKLTTFVPELLAFVSKTSAVSVEPVLINLCEKISKVLVALLIPLVILQNLGVNVASVLAGLGLGGLAFALAAKDTAANIFGSLMIMIDKPFGIGDWVIIDGKEGNVQDIGLRSTRIRTFYDSLISVPNAEVIKNYVDNMGQRNFRRIKTTLGITYNTPPETIKTFLSEIKNIISSHPNSQKGAEHHVVLSNFSESSLDIMLYFFIDVKDWTEELAVRQNIFLDIISSAHQLDVSFAFPTRTLHMEQTQEANLSS